jgi:hypothetical protein
MWLTNTHLPTWTYNSSTSIKGINRNATYTGNRRVFYDKRTKFEQGKIYQFVTINFAASGNTTTCTYSIMNPVPAFNNQVFITRGNLTPLSGTESRHYVYRVASSTSEQDNIIEYNATEALSGNLYIRGFEINEIEFFINGHKDYATGGTGSVPVDINANGWVFHDDVYYWVWTTNIVNGVTASGKITYNNPTQQINYIAKKIDYDNFNLEFVYGTSGGNPTDGISIYIADSNSIENPPSTATSSIPSTWQFIDKISGVTQSVRHQLFGLSGKDSLGNNNYIVFSASQSTTNFVAALAEIKIFGGYHSSNNQQFPTVDSNDDIQVQGATDSSYSFYLGSGSTIAGTYSLSLLSSRFGNGTFKAGVWENGVWNSGWRVDTEIYEFDDIVQNIRIFSDKTWRFSIRGSSISTSKFKVGDKVSIGNIVAIDINEERKLLRGVFRIVRIMGGVIVVDTDTTFPFRRIEKDSPNHKIKVTKNVWLSGGFLNGYFTGIWNYGLFKGLPLLTEMYETNWIDGIFDGGHFVANKDNQVFTRIFNNNGYLGFMIGNYHSGWGVDGLAMVTKIGKNKYSALLIDYLGVNKYEKEILRIYIEYENPLLSISSMIFDDYIKITEITPNFNNYSQYSQNTLEYDIIFECEDDTFPLDVQIGSIYIFRENNNIKKFYTNDLISVDFDLDTITSVKNPVATTTNTAIKDIDSVRILKATNNTVTTNIKVEDFDIKVINVNDNSISGVITDLNSNSLIQNFRFYDNNRSKVTSTRNRNSKSVFSFNSWIDVNYDNTSSVNIGRSGRIFNLFAKRSLSRNNLYGYPTSDVLSSTSTFRDSFSLIKRDYKLGTKYKIFEDFIDEASEFKEPFNSESKVIQTEDSFSETILPIGMGEFFNAGWTFSAPTNIRIPGTNTFTQSYATFSRTETEEGEDNDDEIIKGEELRIVARGRGTILNNNNINIANNRYSVVEFDMLDYNITNPNFVDVNLYELPILNLSNLNYEIRRENNITKNVPMSYLPVWEPVNHLFTPNTKKIEYFFNKKDLMMSISGNGNVGLSQSEFILDNIKFYEVDMIPFFKYFNEQNIYKGVQAPYQGIAPFIDYTDSSFSFIDNISLEFDTLEADTNFTSNTTAPILSSNFNFNTAPIVLQPNTFPTLDPGDALAEPGVGV